MRLALLSSKMIHPAKMQGGLQTNKAQGVPVCRSTQKGEFMGFSSFCSVKNECENHKLFYLTTTSFLILNAVFSLPPRACCSTGCGYGSELFLWKWSAALGSEERAPEQKGSSKEALLLLADLPGQTCSHQLLNCVPRGHPVPSTSLSTSSPQLCPLSPVPGQTAEFLQGPRHKLGKSPHTVLGFCPFSSRFCAVQDVPVSQKWLKAQENEAGACHESRVPNLCLSGGSAGLGAIPALLQQP